MIHWKNFLRLPWRRSAATSLGQAFRTGQDLDGPLTERLVEPYRQSAWVRGAIDKIAGPISAVSVEWYPLANGLTRTRRSRFLRRSPGQDQEEIKLPQMDAFFSEPMRGLGYSDFVEASVGWLKLAGETFWLLPDDALIPFPQQRQTAPQVILSRPDRMRHVTESGQVVGWEFTDHGGRKWSLLPEQVIHLRSWNPYNPHRGLGAYEAAALAADADYLSGKFAKNIAANNGDTGPFIVAKGGIPTDEQREQILTDLRAKRAAQLRGQFRPVFLSGDFTIEDPQIRTIDAAQLAGRIENRHEIFVALGVPPSMADVKAAYSIGSASDFFQLILNTCIPTGEKLADGYSKLARILTGLSVECEFDWDDHPVMMEVRKERLASVDVLWNKGMPLSEISDYLSLCLPRFPGDDVGYLPFGVAPAEASASPAPSPTVAPDLAEPDQDPVSMAIKALHNRKSMYRVRCPDCCLPFDWMDNAIAGSRQAVCPHCQKPCSEDVLDPAVREAVVHDSDCCSCSLESLDTRGRDPKEVAQWKSIIARRLSTIRAYRSKFSRVLMAARREVLGKLEAVGTHSTASPSSRGVASDFLFSLSDFSADFLQSMRAVAIAAVTQAGDQLYKELGKSDPWKNPPQKTIEFLGVRENKLSGVPQEVFERIKSQLEEGFNAGESISKIADRVRSEFNSIDERRGKVIAQTETSAAFGFGRHEAIKSAGITHKKWLTSGNDNVRKAHRQMNLRVVIPIEEPFIVTNPKTGEEDAIMHPGDADGAPWNVINCHCVELPATQAEADAAP